MKIQALKDKFEEIYGEPSESVFFSPGRVNLIGEHIDYNGGMVLPVAINLGTYAVLRKRDDQKVNVISLNFESLGVMSFELDKIKYDADLDWVNYPMGVLYILQQEGFKTPFGFDTLFFGDLPNGAGLSSSASIEVLMATIANEYYGLGLEGVAIAKLCQKSENQFNGVNCGIMDQFSIAMGKKDHAVLLNCDTLEYENVPATLGDYRIVIVNTNKKRGLVDSEYNLRRTECDTAFTKLQAAFDLRKITSLCDLTPTEFLSVSEVLTSDSVYKRAYHAIVENHRTIKSKEALNAGNLVVFGEWMYSSHESLSNYFEVSCKELDLVVKLSRGLRGVLGARMTGAGFGGCAIALVHKDHCASYQKTIADKYKAETDLEAAFYIAQISGGTARVE